MPEADVVKRPMEETAGSGDALGLIVLWGLYDTRGVQEIAAPIEQSKNVYRSYLFQAHSLDNFNKLAH